MYGATTFSTNGFCVITAARMRPMVEDDGEADEELLQRHN